MGSFINPYMTDRHRWLNAVEMTTPKSVAWQRVIARTVSDEESRLHRKSILLPNVANFRLAVRDEDLAPEASIINSHYAYPEAVDWNRGLPRVIGCDETGCAGRDDATYRHQAWSFIFSGGGCTIILITPSLLATKMGVGPDQSGSGGGSPTLSTVAGAERLSARFDPAKMHPDYATVRMAPGVVVRGLSEPGRQYAFISMDEVRAFLKLNLPAGTYESQ